MIKTTVLLFAHFADRAGSNQVELGLADDATVADCAAELIKRYPNLEDLLKVGRTAVNSEFVEGGHRLRDRDEVAFLPPVSGG